MLDVELHAEGFRNGVANELELAMSRLELVGRAYDAKGGFIGASRFVELTAASIFVPRYLSTP